MASKVYTPNLNTVADLVDRLIIDIHKLAWFENEKRRLNKEGNPDPEIIQRLDHASRDCCEIRSALKNELNKTFAEIVNAREYRPLPEARTFAAAEKAADAVAKLCYDRAVSSFTELAPALKEMFYE